MPKDPYKYFRVEARELVEAMSREVLQLERERAGVEAVHALQRQAHTLKGAARIVRQARIAELAHALEDLLGPREAAAVPSREVCGQMLQILDEVAAHVRALDEPTPAPRESGASADGLETIRVEIGQLDGLMRSLTESEVNLGGARRELAAWQQLGELRRALADALAATAPAGPAHASALRRARALVDELGGGLDAAHRGLLASLERAEVELAQAREAAQTLRLVPARTVFPQLERAARDAAEQLGIRVEILASGGEVRLDAQVLAQLRDALVHLVRNAVVHGAESEPRRRAAGKAPIPTIAIEVRREGSWVRFACRDDGAGVDLEAVRAALVARGRLTAEAAATADRDALLQLLAAGGVTTARGVTELAGRGVGLDVAREIAARLRGRLRLDSTPGAGTTAELRVPMSIVALSALVVEVDGAAAAVPLDAVQRIRRVQPEEIARAEARETIVHDGEVIPLVRLAAIVTAGAARTSRAACAAVVVADGDRRVALAVDRLTGITRIVVRPLPAVIEPDAIVAGASLDARGTPQLVLDAAALIEAASSIATASWDDAAADPIAILVIDDSLTTRMLEQSILESAGYLVDLAVSAEEGLAKARQRAYGLFLVDVEMPGMDGFEFVATTRADPELRKVPAILVTSRSSDLDRRRGEQVGASAYVVKGEFDQGRLLQTIERLVG